MFSWFDATEAQKFGVTLAHLVVEKMPLDITKKVKEKAMIKKQDTLLSTLSREIVKFNAKNKLNIYKRAKLGNAFKWTLKDAGYGSEYLETLTQWLMLRF